RSDETVLRKASLVCSLCSSKDHRPKHARVQAAPGRFKVSPSKRPYPGPGRRRATIALFRDRRTCKPPPTVGIHDDGAQCAFLAWALPQQVRLGGPGKIWAKGMGRRRKGGRGGGQPAR